MQVQERGVVGSLVLVQVQVQVRGVAGRKLRLQRMDQLQQLPARMGQQQED
jgi:hypothetical protein